MLLYYTPDEMLRMGLEVAGFNDLRRQPLRTTIEVNRAGKDRKLIGF